MSMPEEKWSPGWRKPSEVMKMRKKKKLQKSSSGGSDKAARSSKSGSSPLRPGIVLKRRNPFGRGGGASVVRRVCNELENSEANEQDIPDNGKTSEHAEIKAESSLVSHQIKATTKPEDPKDAETLLEGEQSVSDEAVQQSLNCPVDWCLHTRIRFTSQIPFDWSSRISSAEEGRGLTNFVQGRLSTQDLLSEESSLEDSLLRQRLKQSVMLWSSPSLPWFKIFPRILPESKDARTSFVVKEENVQKALMTQWFESFCSVYQLLRTGICPYFYVCAHHLTILFRAKHIAGQDSIHAFLGPTTRGFRESLKNEGITFTMPLLKDEGSKYQDPHQVIEKNNPEKDNAETSSCSQSNSLKTEEENDVRDGDNDTVAASWLESIGLNNVLDVNSYRGQLQADPSVRQDNRPQSVVFVEGMSNIQALYNFLLNYKNIVATVGLQAGIPPTILSPMAFHGATLTCCKVKPGCMRQIVGQRIQDIYTLEVSGPILPHNVDFLLNLIAESQEGQFFATFQHHEPTASFTKASFSTSKVSDHNEPHSLHRGFPKDFVDKLYRPQTILRKAWKELKYTNGQFEWTYC